MRSLGRCAGRTPRLAVVALQTCLLLAAWGASGVLGSDLGPSDFVRVAYVREGHFADASFPMVSGQEGLLVYGTLSGGLNCSWIAERLRSLDPPGALPAFLLGRHMTFAEWSAEDGRVSCLHQLPRHHALFRSLSLPTVFQTWSLRPEGVTVSTDESPFLTSEPTCRYSLESQIVGLGFHRELLLRMNWEDALSADEPLLLRFVLPPGLFFDLDELQTIDIEAPSYSSTTTLYELRAARGAGRSTDLRLPLHPRYGRPQSSSPVVYPFSPPAVWRGAHAEACRRVAPSDSALGVAVPVGNTEHRAIVVAATMFAALAGALAVALFAGCY